MSQFFGTLVATLITLSVFSRLWGPNRIFRAAQYILLGLLAGYVAAVALRGVLLPGLISPLLSEPASHLALLIPLALIVLMALRFTRSQRLREIGLLPLALMFGATGALILAGAVRGTLLPQLLASLNLRLFPASPSLDVVIVAFSTLITLAVLAYLLQRARSDESSLSRALAPLGKFGYWALMLACGVALGSLAGARITLLIDRIQYLWDLWSQLLGG